MDKPRIAFLGTGWIGRHRMEAILSTGLVEAVAIADPSEEMVAQAQALAPDAAVVAGLLAGYGIAMPVGPVGTYLVGLTARSSLRVGACAALGVASADGLYALMAAVAGSALAPLLAASGPTTPGTAPLPNVCGFLEIPFSML